MPAPTNDMKPIVAAAANPAPQSVEHPADATHKRRHHRSRSHEKKADAAGLERDRSNSSYEFSAEKGWPENFHAVTAVDKGPHTEFATTPSKAGLHTQSADAAAPAAAAAADFNAPRMGAAFDAAAPAPTLNRPASMNTGALNTAALPTPYAAPAATMAGAAYTAAPYMASAPAATGAGITGFRATVPPSPAHGASTTMLQAGSHQEMTLPLSEAAPELFGGNPAAATPHYDAVGAAGTAAGAGPMPAAFGAAAAARPMTNATPMMMPAYGAAGAVPPSPSGGFRATVPPSPAHAASTTMLGSGSHQEMTLPLSEAAPELFGGNPAASTPHYDAVGAAAGAAVSAPFIPTAAPVTSTPMMNYGAAARGATGALPSTVTPMNYAATPSYNAAGMVPPSPSGRLRATVPPSPAHAASTAVLGSGSHQEMTLPLSEAAPELFGGNPAASTPHYDALAADAGAPGLAAAAGYMGGAVTSAAGPATLPPIASSSFTSMPGIRQPNLNLGNQAPRTTAAAGMPSQFPHITGFNSVVPPSPAHAASSTMVPEGGHQEMVLPLSEAAPELFGGNPGASTPHYDAVMGL